jgi:uncharacterized protein (TIGR02996 family)
MHELPTYALRYLGGGDRKIAAIKLMREVTQRGLAESKHLVDHQQVFAKGLDHTTATAIVDRFQREADSRIAILDEAEYRYAFDPRHPRRSDQPLIRLRWHGPTLAWERGRIGEWTRERETKFDSAAACEQAIAAEYERWTEQGLESAEREVDIVRRTSARELELEQAIRTTAPPDDALAVYADWLQRQGDPRGVVAALDLARARAESPDERERLNQAFVDALSEHRAHLFGPFYAAVNFVRLSWEGGLVIGIEIDTTGRNAPEGWPFADLDLVEGLLALPICACLRSLHVNSGGTGGPAFTTTLMHSDPALLTGLRALVLSSHHEFDGIVDWSRMPRLERLEFVVGALIPIDLPALRELDLTLWRPDTAAAALATSTLPNLRTLALRFDAEVFHGGWPEVPVAGMFAELLALPMLAALDRLVLGNVGDPWPAWVAEILIDAHGLRAVGLVDLREVEFEPDARDLLLAARDRLPNVRID